MKQNRKSQKFLFIFTTLLGIIGAICAAAIPLVHSLVPIAVTKILLYTVGITFVLVIFLSIIRMLFAPQMLVKLAILPVTFAVVTTVVMVYNTQAHMFFLQALSIITPEAYASVNHDTSKMFSPLFMNLGVWVSAAPMFIYGLVKMIKVKKGTPKNLDEYIQGKGRIVHIIDTRTKLQNRSLYNVTIEFNHYGTPQRVEKEIIIPQHIIHVFSINTEVNIFIDPNNTKKIFITTDYGTF